MAKKIKRGKAKGSGRKAMFNEPSGVLAMRVPRSKIEEIKAHVKGMLRNYLTVAGRKI